MPSSCYPACPPPSTVITHAPVVPHVGQSLAFTGFSVMPFIWFAAACLIVGGVFAVWAKIVRSRRRPWWRADASR